MELMISENVLSRRLWLTFLIIFQHMNNKVAFFCFNIYIYTHMYNIFMSGVLAGKNDRPIESIKTTSMEDVSTRVFEKIKNILEGKTKKWSDVSRHI